MEAAHNQEDVNFHHYCLLGALAIAYREKSVEVDSRIETGAQVDLSRLTYWHLSHV